MRCLIVALFLTLPAVADHWINLTVAYPLISTPADSLTGATYYRKHATSSTIASISYGFEATRAIYLGLRYEYWISDRKYDDAAGTSFNDKLIYQTLGGEIGYHGGNPRVFWAGLLGVHYPIAASSGSYSGTKKIAYQFRGLTSIRLARPLWLVFETGYRLANLGAFSDGTSSYCEGAASFDLSGLFLSFGIAFQL